MVAVAKYDEIKQRGIMYNFHGVCLKMLLLVMENYYIYTWKKVREHLLCYEGELWTKFFL